MEKQYSRGYYIYLLIFLGMMSAFGPFVTDMYLPSLPAMTHEFNAGASAVQMGLSASLTGLALGQIIFGPLSDRYGRKPIMFWSLILFSLATIGDIYSTDIWHFNLYRLFQGIGGAGGIVMSRSVATDCYEGKNLAKTMVLIGAINGVAPVAAPVIGGFVAENSGWQGVFWVLLAIGVILLLLTVPFTESLASEKRFRGNVGLLLGNFPRLLKDSVFIRYIAVFACANGVLFGYISSASFIVQDVFGKSEIEFSFLFALNALSIIAGSAVSVRFSSLEKSCRVGAVLSALFTLLIFLNAFVTADFWFYEIFTWFSLWSIGLIFPAISTLAMERGRIAIGAASATLGASGFLAGGIISPLSGMGDIALTSSVFMLLSSLMLLFFTKKIR